MPRAAKCFDAQTKIGIEKQLTPAAMRNATTRIMLLSPTILALGAVATSVLNTMGRFGASAVAPIFYNLAIILAAFNHHHSVGVIFHTGGNPFNAHYFLIAMFMGLFVIYGFDTASTLAEESH